MSVTMSGCGKPKHKFRLNYQRVYAPRTAGIDVKRIKNRFGEVRWSGVYLYAGRARCSCCPYSLGPIASAVTPTQPSVQAFSYRLGDQAQTPGVEPEFGAIDLADLSATTEDYEGGIYDQFADQVETFLAPIRPIDPVSDRMSWAILVIAFAGMTAAASGLRRTRRATISN
jgi:hypothetical protein